MRHTAASRRTVRPIYAHPQTSSAQAITLSAVNDALAAELLDLIPASQRDLSGTAFETGRDAWTGSRPVYLLGFNPGGPPGPDTVYGNAKELLYDMRHDYSNYLDGQWGNSGGRLRAKGTAPLQRSVLHLFGVLGQEPGTVPASNVIFARSRQAHHISREQEQAMAEDCWRLHATMIERLDVKVVVCFGGRATGFVRAKVSAHTVADQFVETYADRSWTSRTFTGPGVSVVQMTHPGRADWTNPMADPTGLVVRALSSV